MSDPDTQNTAGEYVSTAPKTSAIRTAKADSARTGKGKKKSESAQPWRDNIEAIAISIVTIVLFKYFVLEAYRIPTGSMQPTLMGNEETGIYDRVIVDKFSYHFRDPERFEIAVFKYPLESNKNFIKRIIGMPNEDMRLAGGDVFIRPAGESEFRVLRKPRPIQDAQLKLLETGGNWLAVGGARSAWAIEGDPLEADIVARGSGSVIYPRSDNPLSPNEAGSIKDDYVDGYPLGIKDLVDVRRKNTSLNDVTDLRVRAEVEASAGTAWVRFELREAPRTFVFSLPGPAAPAGASAGIEVRGLELDEVDGATSVTATEPFRLTAGESVDVEVQNLDDLLEFRIDGDVIATLEIPPAPERTRSYVEIDIDAADGAVTEVEDVRISRDIYYISRHQKLNEWSIPAGNYVVLGDNSQDSSDGRDWELLTYEVTDGDDAGRVVRGNKRGPGTEPDSNPYRKNDGDGTTLFFRDVQGERHVFAEADARRMADEPSPFVPRELIRGRAVLVVWPFSIKHDVYRWKWVR